MGFRIYSKIKREITGSMITFYDVIILIHLDQAISYDNHWIKSLHYDHDLRAGCSSEVERSLMVRWVVGSILHGVDPLSYFSFQPLLHDWCNKGHGMCYPVCGMVHIKEPLLLIDKSSLCGGSGFPFSLSEWSLTICLTPYNRR